MNTEHAEAARFLTELLGGPLTFADLLSAIRQGEGKSQSEFAHQLGISRSHLCDLEKNRKAVSAERAARFARILGYSPVQFVQLVLQEQVDAAGLGLVVKVTTEKGKALEDPSLGKNPDFSRLMASAQNSGVVS